jgi:hypothetical protein
VFISGSAKIMMLDVSRPFYVITGGGLMRLILFLDDVLLSIDIF